MGSVFCEQPYEMKCHKTRSLEYSIPLQYSHEITRFYETQKFIIVFTKARQFFYTEPIESS
jgi:hypothetical protein